MKAVNGFKPNASVGVERAKLPAGNYPGVILGAKVEKGTFCDQLLLQVEVTEGQYKDFYRKDYEAQKDSQFGQKYKGVLRVNLPMDDGSEYDKWRIQALERIAGALEASNPGYAWDWDEKKLKGKKCGLMVRERSKTFDDGRESAWTEVGSLCDISKVDTAPVLKPKRDGQQAAQSAQQTMTPADDDCELPF